MPVDLQPHTGFCPSNPPPRACPGRLGSAAAMLALACLAGCSLYYKEVIQVEPDGLSQQVQVSDERNQSDATRFAPGDARTGTLKEPGNSPESATVSASLATTPQWILLESPFGTARVFVESRGGAVPVVRDLEQFQDVVDHLCATVADWLQQYGRGDRVVNAAAVLLRTEVKKDLRDLATVVWGLLYAYEFLDAEQLQSSRTKDAALRKTLKSIEEAMQRRLFKSAAAFLVERQWLSPEAGLVMATQGDAMEVSSGQLNTPARLAMGSFLDQARKRLKASVAEFDAAIALFDADALESLQQAIFENVYPWLDDKPHVLAAAQPFLQMVTNRKLLTEFEPGALGAPVLSTGEWVQGKRAVEFRVDGSPWAPGLAMPPAYFAAAWVDRDVEQLDAWFGGSAEYQTALSDQDVFELIVAWQNAPDDRRSQVLTALDRAGPNANDPAGWANRLTPMPALPSN